MWPKYLKIPVLSFYQILTSHRFMFSQRYPQEFTQSEVFEYGHGVRDRPQSQEKGYRSSGHVQSREIQKVE